MTTLARCVFAIPGTEIDSERVFPAADIVSNNRLNRIGVQHIDSIMQIYHNFPDNVLHKDSAPCLSEISRDQPRSDALHRYVSQMTDNEIDILVALEEDFAVVEAELRAIDV